LPRPARVLDLGCGNGALLAWLATRGPIEGLGIDLVRPLRRIAGVRLVAGDANDVVAGGNDLTCSVGAITPLEELAALTRGDGLVLYGAGDGRRPPSGRYLRALGATEDELMRWQETRWQGEPLGLRLLADVRSSTADWVRYEDAWAGNGERYAAQHAG